jgi:hypothetical protein
MLANTSLGAADDVVRLGRGRDEPAVIVEFTFRGEPE